MNVLSLFDGISCGQLALQRAGIKVTNYFASEIDKHAIAVTQKNWPKTIQLGDVTKINGKDLPKIDILLGGSPCCGFSFAGKQFNFEDPRSKLFFDYVRLLKECQPTWFLLENVRMKKEYSQVISEHLGVDYIQINSSLLSAQNRVRYYWSNIPGIRQPEDKKIFLKDVIGEDYDGIWVWPRGVNKGDVKDYNKKSPSVTTSSWEHNFLIYKNKPNESNLLQEGYIDSNGQGNRVYSIDGKSPCLNATSGGIAGPGNALITGAGLRGRKIDNVWKQIPTLNKNEKSYTITSQFGGKTDFVYLNGKVRKFTPIEAERLQTISDGYTDCIPKSQRYKAIGNAWTVDVIAHILSFLLKEA